MATQARGSRPKGPLINVAIEPNRAAVRQRSANAANAAPAVKRNSARARPLPGAPRRRGAQASAPRWSRSSAHRVEELLVRLRAAHLREQELHRIDGVQGMEQLPQDPDAVELLLVHQELLLARAGAVDVEAGEDALLHQLAVEDDLAVSRSLELLEDHLVHARAAVYHPRSD